MAAGLAAVVGLIVLVPGLLVPREPESLPADVGLATGAGDTYAYVDPEPRGDRPAGEAGRVARSGAGDQHREGPARRRRRPTSAREPAPEPEPAARASEPASAPTLPSASGPAPDSPSTPAAPPTPPAAPEPPDQPDEPPPPPDRDPPAEGDPAAEPSPGPTQFGFEQRPQGIE